MLRPISALLVAFSLVQASGAQTLSIESPITQVKLLELYTSEGCSSCPPADRWIGTLKDDERLWKAVVPVAFHVDYWDYIGWPDRFAKPIYGQRQRSYARHGGISTVYTPGFVLNGKEWRRWFSGPHLEVGGGPEVGTLRVDIDEGSTTVVFEPKGQLPESPELHFAILGFGLTTQVKAGENRGRTLTHDFVVLAYGRTLFEQRTDGYRSMFELPVSKVDAPVTAIAAWVSGGRDPTPIQSVGGWLP